MWLTLLRTSEAFCSWRLWFNCKSHMHFSLVHSFSFHFFLSWSSLVRKSSIYWCSPSVKFLGKDFTLSLNSSSNAASMFGVWKSLHFVISLDKWFLRYLWAWRMRLDDSVVFPFLFELSFWISRLFSRSLYHLLTSIILVRIKFTWFFKSVSEFSDYFRVTLFLSSHLSSSIPSQRYSQYFSNSIK